MKPETRNKGIGKALFAELAKVAQDKVVYLLPLLLPCGSTTFFPGRIADVLIGPCSRWVHVPEMTTLGNSFRNWQWNEPSIAFYEKVLSAKRMDGWMGMRLTDEGIQNLTKFALVAN